MVISVIMNALYFVHAICMDWEFSRHFLRSTLLLFSLCAYPKKKGGWGRRGKERRWQKGGWRKTSKRTPVAMRVCMFGWVGGSMLREKDLCVNWIGAIRRYPTSWSRQSPSDFPVVVLLCVHPNTQMTYPYVNVIWTHWSFESIEEENHSQNNQHIF